MNLVDPAVMAHLEQLASDRPEELRAMEIAAKRTGFPIIGPAAGQFCHLVARLAGARSVFELGSGFGYSTAWFARAVVANGGGVVHHTVWDDKMSARARTHLAALGYADVVRFTVGEAVAALGAEPGPFDLVFCDIDKADYPAALPVIKDRLRSGGVLIADNVLWSGRIFDAADQSAETAGIREFTARIHADPDWVAGVVPIRDGLLVARLR